MYFTDFKIKNEIRLLDQDLDLQTIKLSLLLWFAQINPQQEPAMHPYS